MTATAEFYVYALLDTRIKNETFGYRPFYIGKGKGKREQAHLQNYKSAGGNALKESKIKDIRSAGYEPQISYLRYFETEEEALKYEAELIKSCGRIIAGTGHLTNLSEGGDGGTAGIPCSDAKKAAISKANTGKIRTEEVKAKMRVDRKGRAAWNKGVPHSEETRQKLKEARSRQTNTPESNAKRSATLKGRKFSQETIEKIKQTKAENRKLMNPEELEAKASSAALKAWETRRKNQKENQS